MKILAKYTNNADVFFFDLVIEFYKNIDINYKYAIKPVENK